MEKREDIREMKICRLCLRKQGSLFNMYDVSHGDAEQTLADEIQVVFDLEVNENDGKPKCICSTCRRKTREAYELWNTCRRSDDGIVRYMGTGDIAELQAENVQADTLVEDNEPSSSAGTTIQPGWPRGVNSKLHPETATARRRSSSPPIEPVHPELPEPVQELIRLIFDVDTMKKVISEYGLNIPLEELSKTQLLNAYNALSQLHDVVEANQLRRRGTRLDLCTRASVSFYEYIPHRSLSNPIIYNKKMIEDKLHMVDHLMELEVAYSVMKSAGGDRTIDALYRSLKAEIDILQRESDEFGIIEEYVRNTHAAAHSNFKMELEHVFTVKRQAEEEVYEEFRKKRNRWLLWHGSRITNFVGILSQGLRIAPPQAPPTGYMFGKGIYFADMVSKSANYCIPAENEIGLLLLCEVALGQMRKYKKAKYITILPDGKQSVMGVGKTQPDPHHIRTLAGGVQVPCGNEVPSNTTRTTLDFNEYVVYDEARVKIKYLLKVNFK